MEQSLSKEILNDVLLAEQKKWLAYNYDDLKELADSPGGHRYEVAYDEATVFVELRFLEALDAYLHPELTVGDGTYVIVRRLIIFSKVISNQVSVDWIVYSEGCV